MPITILTADDEPVQRRLASEALTRAGYRVVEAESGEDALHSLSDESAGTIDLVLLDLMMPGMDGLQTLEAMREKGFDQPVVVLTAKGGMDSVIAAMRAGAFDYVVKPVAPERLRATIHDALKVKERVAAPRRRKNSAPNASTSFDSLVGRSEAMGRVLAMAKKAAASNIPIIIEGESGVGKEKLARAIANASDRSRKKFVTVNCGAIPKDLVESILFGHEKGAFTGATERQTGKFVEADDGTLFLDEIGDLPLEAQVKLLRAVQEGEVDPVGARQTRQVDVRFISATHHDLLAAVQAGKFREDLFYRLSVFPIRMPPLRERREDIVPLAEQFTRNFARSEGASHIKGIDRGALNLLTRYDWPGNIRQLENTIFRAVVLADGPQLTQSDFPQIATQLGTPVSGQERHMTNDGDQSHKNGSDEVGGLRRAAEAMRQAEHQPVAGPLSDTLMDGFLAALDSDDHIRPLTEIEEEMIRLAIDHYGGQMSEVARRLGIGRSTLYRKLKEYDIDPEAMRDVG
ncbi:sigma-54 dependent transcriptional regulator [Notoacmeibacter sp. MSK16QG-6]|uniref:sigma-54-dependent transcriptional regulator n=1 Tax=Notoacmeibacter sp. MSK16QG-6 TaxID=2957982 RepID=UPI00209F0F12|nr:sigma-54 dependent transcriptional regulator [Notoacmeibacter sp. MSK16QG-6]MCP1200374.1 sigma-54 dependent transcriptional regulator [Notoacmeibacter sp. MSK16QG-6]